MSSESSSLEAYNPPHETPIARTRTIVSETLSRVHTLRSNFSSRDLENKKDQEDLLQLIESHKEPIGDLVTRLETRAGQLGPLEDPIDLERTVSRPALGKKPEAEEKEEELNDLDEWKYPIDKETGLRIVSFFENDPVDPRNFPKWRKWFITYYLGLVCFTVAIASAIVTGDIKGPAKEFNVSEEVVILTVTLIVLGFGFGPLIFAPLSEEVGRYPIYVGTLGLAVIFVLPCALAKNIGTLLVCRFLDGIFFSAPMCLIGGNLAEMWRNEERGVAMAVFSAAPFLGPAIGPLVGGYIGDNVGWRWIYWVLLIFSGVVYAVMIFVIPETHHQTLLKRRAKELRRLTGDSRYRAISEIKIRDMKEIVNETISRPLILLREPIVFLITIYMSLIYGLLYMFFFAYPVIYMEGKKWSASKTGLMFIPIAVGVIIAAAVSPFFNNDYNKRAKKYTDRGELPPPELRLIPMMVGCWSVPAGLFAFAWSSMPHISWAGPCFSGLACGFGFTQLYNPANNYIVDSYQHYAASGLAAKTFLRSMWGAVVPLFTIQMYHGMGYEWASSLLAFVSLACCAIPYVFFFFGARIRAKSKYAYSPEGAETCQDEEKASHNSH